MRRTGWVVLGVAVGTGVGLLMYRVIDAAATDRFVGALRNEEQDENVRLALYAGDNPVTNHSIN